MSHGEEASVWTRQAIENMDSPQEETVVMRDRSIPMWATTLSALFGVGAAICYASLAIFALFLHQLVALQGIEIFAPILGLSALVPVLGIILFEAGHARALAGHRDIRRRQGPIGEVVFALLVTGGLFMLHPLLSLPVLGTALLGWFIAHPLARLLPKEQAWDILPTEAASVLSGRDKRGLELLNSAETPNPLIPALLNATLAISFIASYALSSWLSYREVLTPAAVAATALLTLGATHAALRLWRATSPQDPEQVGRAASVQLLPPQKDEASSLDSGLWVENLSVTNAAGRTLLHNMTFHLQPGSVTGLNGDSFAGKSLLMAALTAPHDMEDMHIAGHVSLQGRPLWPRQAQDRSVPAVHIPPHPLTIPGSGNRNLDAFLPDTSHRAAQLLKSLLHNTDTVERILSAPRIQTLSDSERKALSFARAFSMRPMIYLIDRPEDGSNELLRTTLLSRLQEERRRGAITLLITEDRALLDSCDQIMMMQNGRLVEMASAEAIRARASSGWQRFVTKRDLESEDALDSWIPAQFRRDGDDANRRAVCMIANEMLALACRTEVSANMHSVCFEIKLFEGRCLLRLQQEQPLSSGALERAQQAADSDASLTNAPLARILRESLGIENIEHEAQHWMQVAIGIYDPRKARPVDVRPAVGPAAGAARQVEAADHASNAS